MSKKIYLFSLVLLALAFVSCSETEEEGKFANWRARNEAFLDSLQQVYDAKTDPELEFFVPFTDPGMKIFYKRTVKNDEGRRPVIPNVVSAYYRGSYYTGEVFDQNFTGKDPGDFDSPTEFWVNPISMSNPPHIIPVDGWIEKLQRMRTGERWTVYLPWDMGYGTSDRDGMPGYSVLVFDIKLESVVSDY